MDNAADEVIVPKLLLQPIVENSVVHGLFDKDSGEIYVSIKIEEGFLVINVWDNGCGISDEKLLSIQTDNEVDQRVRRDRANTFTL